MEIKITLKYYEYLRSYFKVEKPNLFKQLKASKGDTERYEVTEDWMLSVRDWAGERLQKVVFDENYGLTQHGAYLEYLIDLLYI